jgi:tetratricopeptide (TPR) repeat protein
VQLSKRGRHQEALEHYRRAYELMPDSFGRVESHCFGCESVFKEADAQRVAEQVFNELIKTHPKKPQAHYMLGYLREEQGRYQEALQAFRVAVALDDKYLNAWKHLHDLAEHIYIDAGERDIARLKLLELDPRRHHVRYNLNKVGDLANLWRALERSAQSQPEQNSAALYPLRRSAANYTAALEKLPEPIRLQMQHYQDFMLYMQNAGVATKPQQVLAEHDLIEAIGHMLGVKSEME